jgi:hypothetical protein
MCTYNVAHISLGRAELMQNVRHEERLERGLDRRVPHHAWSQERRHGQCAIALWRGRVPGDQRQKCQDTFPGQRKLTYPPRTELMNPRIGRNVVLVLLRARDIMKLDAEDTGDE